MPLRRTSGPGRRGLTQAQEDALIIGGMDDLVAAFDTPEDARAAYFAHKHELYCNDKPNAFYIFEECRRPPVAGQPPQGVCHFPGCSAKVIEEFIDSRGEAAHCERCSEGHVVALETVIARWWYGQLGINANNEGGD